MSEIDKNTPLHTYWTHTREGKAVVNYNTCPACKKYPVRNKPRCPYCGQKLILPDDISKSIDWNSKVWIL